MAPHTYVSILPSFRGFASELQSGVGTSVAQIAREIVNDLGDAGTRAGQQFGEGFTRDSAGRLHDARGRFVREWQEAGARAGEEAGGGFGEKMATAAAAAGAAAGAALTAGIAEVMERERASDLLAAQLGATPDVARRYGSVAGDLYASAYGESFAEVNSAVGVVVSSIRGMNAASTADIKSVTAAALDFASAFEIDVSRAVSVAGTVINAGLANSATEALDLITAASQRVPAALRENVLDAADEYGQFFHSLGFTGQQAFGLLVKAAAKGEFGIDKIGDAIKESTLLLTDVGNTDVVGAYSAIGLDAGKMSNAILAGGATAQVAFQKIVTGLQGIKDPSKQAAAAVALFGTPLEDLNKAEIPEFLSQLATVGNGLGDVSGASARLGETLADNASTRITAFKREAISAFVDVLGGQVLPKLAQWGGWLKEHRPVLVALAVAAGMVGTAMAISATKTAVATASTYAHTVATNIGIVASKAASAATKVWAAAQWALNAAFVANPIGLIVLGIVALVAAIVIAWQQSETFRDVVIGAWEGIKTAALWAWDNALKPTFSAIWTGLQFLGGIFVWLYDNVISPVWSGISLAISVAWALIQVVWGMIQIGIQVLAATFTWLWTNVISPVWSGISLAISVAWALIQVVWGLIQIGIKILAANFTWLWTNVLSPVWNAIAAAATWLWTNVLSPVWGAMKAAWSGLMTAMSWVWTNVLSPVFSALGSAVGKVKDAFGVAVDGIAAAWNKVREVAAIPVRFVVNTIINDGIIGGYNKIASKFGVSTVDPIKLGFASGGRIPGAPSAVDNLLAAGPGGVPVALATGEYVVNASQTSKWLPVLEWINSGARGFADGGLMEWFTNPIGAAKSTFGGALNRLRQVEGTAFGQVLSRFPRAVVDWVVDKVKGLVGGIGGAGGWQWQMSVLRSVFPGLAMLSGSRPGATTVTGNRSYHASGRAVDLPPRADVFNWIRATYGRKTKELIFSPMGDLQIHNGSPHTYGGRVRDTHWDHVHWALRNGGLLKFDDGGYMPRGLSLNLNDTGKPERVLTDRQWAAVEGAVRGGDGAEQVHYHLHGPTTEIVDRLEAHQAAQRARQRMGRPR